MLAAGREAYPKGAKSADNIPNPYYHGFPKSSSSARGEANGREASCHFHKAHRLYESPTPSYGKPSPDRFSKTTGLAKSLLFNQAAWQQPLKPVRSESLTNLATRFII
jgi:hypothetical protein